MGFINSWKRVLTTDTGASQSIIWSDLISEPLKPLNGVRLCTPTGEPPTVYGKVKLKLTIANITADHAFIIADSVDEVIIGVDFMIAQGLKLDMGQQVMKIPLTVGYDNTSECKN